MKILNKKCNLLDMGLIIEIFKKYDQIFKKDDPLISDFKEI